MIPDRDQLRKRALAAVGRFHSGHSDTSQKHDDVLAEQHRARDEDEAWSIFSLASAMQGVEEESTEYGAKDMKETSGCSS